MAKTLLEMSVEELEQESYRLTAERQKIRNQAIAVQNELGRKNEQARISKLLGRDVQIVEANGIEAEG